MDLLDFFGELDASPLSSSPFPILSVMILPLQKNPYLENPFKYLCIVLKRKIQV